MDDRFVTIEDHRVHYLDVGEGPPLLFLHAAPLWSYTYRHLIGALSPTFRCIALDYPGFGKSIASRPLDLMAQSDVVGRFVEALDLREVVVVMNDVGGAIGVAATERQPWRYRGFVAIDALGFSLRGFRYIQLVLGLMRLPGARWLHRLTNALRHGMAWGGLPWRLGRGERQQLLMQLDRPVGRDATFDLLAELGGPSPFLNTLEDRTSQLADRPVLTLFGSHDPARLSGFPQRWERGFRDVSHRVVPGGGHFCHEDDPGFCAEQIARWHRAKWPRRQARAS